MVGDVVWFMPRIRAGPMGPRLRPQQRCIRSCIDCCAARHSPLRCQHPIRVPSLKTAISDVFDQHQLIPIPILDIRVRIILSLDSRPPSGTAHEVSKVYPEGAGSGSSTHPGQRGTVHTVVAPRRQLHREARLVRLQRCHTTCGVDGPLIHGYGLGMFWLRHAAAAASADDRHVSWLRGRLTIAVGGTRCKHASVFQRARACAR